MKSALTRVMLLCSVAPFAWPASAATPISGHTLLVATASVNGPAGTVEQQSPDFRIWNGVPTPLSSTVSASVVSGGGAASAIGVSQADWFSADDGAFRQALHSDLTGPSSGSGASASFDTEWRYAFFVDEDLYFNLSYDFSGVRRNETQWAFAVNDHSNLEIPAAAGNSGTLSVLLHAMHPYKMNLAYGAGAGAAAGEGPFHDDFISDFHWNISDQAEGTIYRPVPEPASWALFIAGFGGAGALIRRRRAVALATA